MAVTRREFLRSTSTLGALTVLGGGPVLLNACHGGGHYQAPEEWGDGETNVSELLTNWLAAAEPGDVFKLSRRQDGTPGRYWIPQGIKISRDGTTLDLNGCALITKETLGFDDPDIVANAAAMPPLWDDWDELSTPGLPQWDWPAKRCNVVIAASDVTVMSSVPGARIQGACRTVAYRAPESNGRRFATGPIFHSYLQHSPPYDIGMGDGQHGIRIGGGLGAWSDTHSYSNITIDLNNVSVEFTHGDGVYLGDNHHNIRILGHNLGEQALGGTPDHTWLAIVGWSGQGGTIVEGATLADDRWVPDEDAAPWPGIHHCGRQGVATDGRNYDTLLEGVAIWRVGRACVDWEPATANAEIVNPRMLGVECGIHHLRMIAAGGQRSITGLVVDGLASWEKAQIDTRSSSAPGRHSNWILKGIRVDNGLESAGNGNNAAFWLDRVDNCTIEDCYVPVRVNSADGGVEIGNGTGITFVTPESEQFPTTF
jgi:hypothetical protein